MARCYQCGIQTTSYTNDSPLCDDCERKLTPRPKARTLQQVNADLNQARENYRAATAIRAALGSEQSFASDLEKQIAMQSADHEVELAAMKFREALRDFVVGLKREKA